MAMRQNILLLRKKSLPNSRRNYALKLLRNPRTNVYRNQIGLVRNSEKHIHKSLKILWQDTHTRALLAKTLKPIISI